MNKIKVAAIYIARVKLKQYKLMHTVWNKHKHLLSKKQALSIFLRQAIQVRNKNIRKKTQLGSRRFYFCRLCHGERRARRDG